MSAVVAETPPWLWGDTTVDPRAAATVHDMVVRRLDGAERTQVLSMLFDEPKSNNQVSPTLLRQGKKLPTEAKEQILRLVATGISDSEVADELGVSRQAVTGVRSHYSKTTTTHTQIAREEPIMTTTASPSPATILKGRKPEPQHTEWPDDTSSPGDPSPAAVRAWARENGFDVNPRGKVKTSVVEAYLDARAEPQSPLDVLTDVVADAELAAREAVPHIFAQADDAVEAELAARGAFNPPPAAMTETGLDPEPDPERIADDIIPRPTSIELERAPVAACRSVIPPRAGAFPLTSSDLREIADALEALEQAPLAPLIAVLDRIPVSRPGGGGIVGYFEVADGFADDPWLGFTAETA